MPQTVGKFWRALETNDTGTSFTAKAPTTTKPSGAGVFDLLDDNYGARLRSSLLDGLCIPKFIQLVPFGTDTNNDTFDMQLWAWNVSDDLNVAALDEDGLWIPQKLIELNVTMGNIAQGTASTFMADTIVIADGDTDAEVLSYGTDEVASILVHLRGAELIEFDWDLAGASEGTGMNCYWRLLDQS